MPLSLPPSRSTSFGHFRPALCPVPRSCSDHGARHRGARDQRDPPARRERAARRPAPAPRPPGRCRAAPSTCGRGVRGRRAGRSSARPTGAATARAMRRRRRHEVGVGRPGRFGDLQARRDGGGAGVSLGAVSTCDITLRSRGDVGTDATADAACPCANPPTASRSPADRVERVTDQPDLSTTAGKIADLRSRYQEAVVDAEKTAQHKQHAKGKLTARAAHRDAGRHRQLRRVRRVRAPPHHRVRHGQVPPLRRLRRHRRRHDPRPHRRRLRPGLLDVRRIARRGRRREDHQDHGVRPPRRHADASASSTPAAPASRRAWSPSASTARSSA